SRTCGPQATLTYNSRAARRRRNRRRRSGRHAFFARTIQAPISSRRMSKRKRVTGRRGKSHRPMYCLNVKVLSARPLDQLVIKTLVVVRDRPVGEAPLCFQAAHGSIDLFKTSHGRAHLLDRVAVEPRAAVVDALGHTPTTERDYRGAA